MPPSTRAEHFLVGNACTNPDCAWAPSTLVVAGTVVYSACGTHATDLFRMLRDLKLPENTCIACQATRPVAMIDDGDWTGALCVPHLIAYNTHTLSPEVWRRLVRDAGGDPELVFALHGDFYDPDSGESYQPVGVPLSRTVEFIERLLDIPELDPEEAGYDAAAYAQIANLVREDYAVFGGPVEELPECAVQSLATSAALMLSFRRSHGSHLEPSQEAFAQLRERIRLLLAEEKPAKPFLGPDDQPYRREAAWVAQRVQNTSADSDRIADYLSMAFGRGLTTDAAEQRSTFRSTAERILREVLSSESRPRPRHHGRPRPDSPN